MTFARLSRGLEFRHGAMPKTCNMNFKAKAEPDYIQGQGISHLANSTLRRETEQDTHAHTTTTKKKKAFYGKNSSFLLVFQSPFAGNYCFYLQSTTSLDQPYQYLKSTAIAILFYFYLLSIDPTLPLPIDSYLQSS